MQVQSTQYRTQYRYEGTAFRTVPYCKSLGCVTLLRTPYTLSNLIRSYTEYIVTEYLSPIARLACHASQTLVAFPDCADNPDTNILQSADYPQTQ